MQLYAKKLKIITIGDYKNSTLENYFKDNENIEKLNNKMSYSDVVFLRSDNNLKNRIECSFIAGKFQK